MVISFVSLLRVGAVRTELGLNNGHERERYIFGFSFSSETP